MAILTGNWQIIELAWETQDNWSLELEDYLVIVWDLSYPRTELRMKCQLFVGQPLNSERSLVKKKIKWMNENEK